MVDETWLTVVGLVQNSNVGGYSSKGFVEVLAASQTQSGSRWFQGTADAVRQYLWLFEDAERSGVEDFLILSGDTCISVTSPIQHSPHNGAHT